MVSAGIQRRKPHIITLDTIPPQEITWLWKPYIPIGMVTAIFGRGGAGKTYITCEIASKLSTGTPLPDADENKLPQKVLMLSAEDDYAKVLVPRLITLGANLANIAVPDMQFTLDPWGIDQVTEMMRDFSATVVFIDPIVYYAGGKMDINRSNEVRAMMEKLKASAEQAQCAVIVVGHTRKSVEGAEADSMMGSADWINASRSSVLVTKTNDGTRMFKHVKANNVYGKHRAFTIDGDGLHWGEAYTDDELPPTGGGSGSGNAKTAEARAFLQAFLGTGSVRASEVLAAAKDEGISPATLNRAKLGFVESVYNKTISTYVWRIIQKDRAP